MSHLIGKLRHSKNGKEIPIYEGFSWPCLFFWFFWYLYKGMWGWAIVSCLTSGFGWLILPFFANGQYRSFLLKKGYEPDENSKTEVIPDEVKCPYCAEWIKAEAKICRFCGKELRQETVSVNNEDVLRSLKNYSPKEFEVFVFVFLKKIFNSDDGYVTQETRDGGIDGYVNLNRMGLGDVPYQAKLFDSNSIGRPEIQKFIGALHGKKVAQAVFVTTSTYTKDARECAERASVNLRLIDGEEIVKLVGENNLQHLIKKESVSSMSANVAEPQISFKGDDFEGLISEENKKTLEKIKKYLNLLPKWAKIVLIIFLFVVVFRIFHSNNRHRNISHHSSNQ